MKLRKITFYAIQSQLEVSLDKFLKRLKDQAIAITMSVLNNSFA